MNCSARCALGNRLRTSRRISHVFVMDVPSYPKLLLITDVAVNIYPKLKEKVDIVQNAIDLAHVLGISEPKVAILSAVETVNPDIESTLEAAALCKMADRGQITGGILMAHWRSTMPSAAGRSDEEDQITGRRSGRYLAGARPRGRQHAGQAALLPGWCGWAGIVLGREYRSCSQAVPIRCEPLASTAVMVLVANARRTGNARPNKYR